jgi:hypothetical protein
LAWDRRRNRRPGGAYREPSHSPRAWFYAILAVIIFAAVIIGLIPASPSARTLEAIRNAKAKAAAEQIEPEARP